MKSLKSIYLAVVLTPILFSGCSQERVSEVTPQKLTERNITSNQKVTPQKFLSSISKSSENNLSTSPLRPIASNPETLDSLTELVEKNIDMDIQGEEGVFSTAIEIGEDWVELTKEDEIIATAKDFLGTKYVWAANGPLAFDCSGFTRYVYKQNGLTLPRYSGHQAKVGIKVSYDELEKGDLVFFDTEKKFHHKVNHVGIYMGDGKFIHASSAKKKVIITNFNQKTFYKRRFLWGQRVIDSDSNYASL
jgi:cell wall-associated NlpC family hydrolase